MAATGNGSPVPGCDAITAIVNVVSGVFTCNPASVVNGTVSTAGRSILTIQDTISGSSATSNFLNITGTFPATLSAEAIGALVDITTASQNVTKSGLKVNLSGTGSNTEFAIRGSNAATAGAAIGIGGEASGASGLTVGMRGIASAGTTRVGGWFGLGTAANPSASTALWADNGSVAANIAMFADNGTGVVCIVDGGDLQFGCTSTYKIASNGNAALNSNTFNVAQVPTSIGGAGQGFRDSTTFRLHGNTSLTPDAPAFGLKTLSNSIHFAEEADFTASYDFQNGRCGTSACNDPAIISHSRNQATDEYVQLSNDGTLSHLDGQATANGNGQFAFAGVKSLTESSATVVVDIPVASGAYTGATINWTVVASDATDHQSRRGSTYLAVVNKAGTETCSVGDVGTTVVAVSTGTLTVTTGQDTTGANVCTFTINAVSSLTQTTLRAHYSVIVDGPGIPAAR